MKKQIGYLVRMDPIDLPNKQYTRQVQYIHPGYQMVRPGSESIRVGYLSYNDCRNALKRYLKMGKDYGSDLREQWMFSIVKISVTEEKVNAACS